MLVQGIASRGRGRKGTQCNTHHHDAKPTHCFQSNLVDEVSLSFLETEAKVQIEKNGPFATGVTCRPFYRAIAHNLKECCANGVQLPPLMLEDPLNLLSSQNSQR